MQIRLLTILLLLLLCPATHARRRALVVGISVYRHWSGIHGSNDAKLLRKSLKECGFADITLLTDSKATYRGIETGINRLINRTAEGDTVLLHLSGHGQPVFDVNKDEYQRSRNKNDIWDESFVPYDAPQTYSPQWGELGNHIIDDKMEDFRLQLCRKVGPDGLVIISIDACFSGTISRDISFAEETCDVYPEDVQDIQNLPDSLAPQRGYTIPYSRQPLDFEVEKQRESEYKLPRDAQEGKLLMLEACTADQRSREIQLKDGTCYGPLSYALACAFRRKDPSDLQAFLVYTRSVMQHITNRRQRMVCERNF